jgi:hypothetical protein
LFTNTSTPPSALGGGTNSASTSSCLVTSQRTARGSRPAEIASQSIRRLGQTAFVDVGHQQGRATFLCRALRRGEADAGSGGSRHENGLAAQQAVRGDIGRGGGGHGDSSGAARRWCPRRG